MVRVSVIMPVYNTEEIYLRESIESILNQNYTDFEFIIIDDGSTNNAPDVMQEYANKDCNTTNSLILLDRQFDYFGNPI